LRQASGLYLLSMLASALRGARIEVGRVFRLRFATLGANDSNATSVDKRSENFKLALDWAEC